jgi:integrase
LSASALTKLYQTTSDEFGKTRSRMRQDITRSRGKKDTILSPKTGKEIKNPNALHFSEKNNKEIVDFARATGLRRSELGWVRGTDLVFEKGEACLHIIGKGGKERLAVINGPHSKEIIERCESAGRNLLFPKVPKGMDVHKYRAMYAVDLYKQFAKPADKLVKGAIYKCRGEKEGIIYDKDAMKIVTKNLGHNRISVIASNYLYGLE